ncbi:MAG: hypothetical protein IAF94_10015 [Pirellulaceae bacterium]|nr:hypothetical protein [Pirellulaceae bacterium]
MTLPSRRKHPTTAPNSRKGKAGTDAFVVTGFSRFINPLKRVTTNCLAAAGISAAIALTSIGAEPSYFTEDDLAQTVPQETRQAEVSQPLAEAAVLRWKTSRISRGSDGEFSAHSRSATVITASHDEAEQRDGRSVTGLRPAFQAPAKAGAWNKSKAGSPSNLLSDDGAIRLVAHDPRTDPFGDRVSQAGREPALTAPAGTRKAALNDQAEEVAQPNAAEPRPRAPGNLKPADDLPTPMDKAVPGAEDTNPMPPAGTEPMTDTYNYRNCDEAEEGCKRFVETLRGVPLAAISLNIMPRYKPDAKSQEEDDKNRMEQLKNSTSRDWKDRTGRLLATGRLADLKYGRVIITDDAGTQVAALLMRDLGADELCFLTGWWRLPGECPIANTDIVSRSFIPSTFTWTASALCHKPLYFEEVQLERYGHTAGPIKQPILSGAHFFFNIAALPYKMAINPPMECQYPLGYYRPGDCAPWHIPPIPFSLRGAAAETGVWVGGIFLVP